jgi:predicted thioesterase
MISPVLPRRLLATWVAVLVLVFTAATGAQAAIVTSHDDQGRTITFDVRAQTVNTEWYASVLRAAAHGDEISKVTIRIVPANQVTTTCGSNDAAACYGNVRGAPTIVIPVGQSAFNEGTLLHEYGHHLDTAWHVAGEPELNGTQLWWDDRGIASLFANHTIAFDYSLGWSHSIPEIFAEDYAYMQMPGYSYGIDWLSPPDATLKAALFAELGTPTSALPPASAEPLVVVRTGTLAPRGERVLKFGLLGPGRHVTLTATVTKPKRNGLRARAQVLCNGSVVATQTFTHGRTQRILDLPGLGPASCEARLVSTAVIRLSYTLKLSLAIEAAG